MDEDRVGLELAHERGHELLLVRDAAEVGAVADAVADAQELQRLHALQGVRAGGESEPGMRVADVAADAHVDAADRVRHVDDARPADRGGEVDLLAGELFDVSAVQARPP